MSSDERFESTDNLSDATLAEHCLLELVYHVREMTLPVKSRAVSCVSAVTNSKHGVTSFSVIGRKVAVVCGREQAGLGAGRKLH